MFPEVRKGDADLSLEVKYLIFKYTLVELRPSKTSNQLPHLLLLTNVPL